MKDDGAGRPGCGIGIIATLGALAVPFLAFVMIVAVLSATA